MRGRWLLTRRQRLWTGFPLERQGVATSSLLGLASIGFGDFTVTAAAHFEVGSGTDWQDAILRGALLLLHVEPCFLISYWLRGSVWSSLLALLHLYFRILHERRLSSDMSIHLSACALFFSLSAPLFQHPTSNLPTPPLLSIQSITNVPPPSLYYHLNART